MAKVYLGLGTNLGDKEQNLHSAILYIEKQIGTVVSLSAFYNSEPWGFESANSFLNAVLCVETNLLPLDLLHQTKQIEVCMGRTAKSSDGIYSDRIMDIDLLLYDALIMETPQLVLPHPLMNQRVFVMEPLAQIAPDLKHPVLHSTMAELLKKIS
jgi:2-amino-4-hydroxy-6-hydroxymethyldihydropteridine diphosphokinase